MSLSLRQIVRWLRANLRSWGTDLESLDITEGTDAVLCALRSGGRACAIRDFYAGLYPKESPRFFRPSPKSMGVAFEDRGRKRRIGNVQTAEQFSMLAKMGLARDLRGRK